MVRFGKPELVCVSAVKALMDSGDKVKAVYLEKAASLFIYRNQAAYYYLLVIFRPPSFILKNCRQNVVWRNIFGLLV